MLMTFNISQKDLKNPTKLSIQIRKELDQLLQEKKYGMGKNE